VSEHRVSRSGRVQVRVGRIEGTVYRRNRRTRRGIVAALVASVTAAVVGFGVPAVAQRPATPKRVAVETVSEGIGESSWWVNMSSLPECAVEDGSDLPAGSGCAWHADDSGNGEGTSFYVVRNADGSGTFTYADGSIVTVD